MPISDYLRALRDRVGHDFLLVPGVAVLVFNERNEILLNRRTDNGKWSIIGGSVDPGETPAEAARREILEETGMSVAIERVSGVYTLPIITYPAGDVCQYVSVAFRCRPTSGTPRAADDESYEAKYFPLEDLPADLGPTQRQQILDAARPGADIPAVY